MHFPKMFPPFSLLLLIVAVLLNGAWGGTDCTPSGYPNMNCDLLTTTACKNRTQSLYVPVIPGENPDKPRDLKLTFTKTLKTDGKYYTGLKVAFKGPDNISLRAVKAFELKLIVMSGSKAGKFICRLFDLSAANITSLNVMDHIEFNVAFSTLMQQTQYIVIVTSLPEPSVINQVTKKIFKYITTPEAAARVVDINNTGNYAFFIETVFDDDEIKVTFSDPPAAYGFTQYRVQIIKVLGKDDFKNVKQELTMDTTVVFKDLYLTPGMYQVWIQPESKNKNCPCKIGSGCSSCLISRSTPMNITTGSAITSTTTQKASTKIPKIPVTPSGHTGKQPPSESTTSTGSPKLGLLLGISIPVTIILVVMVVLVVVFHRRCLQGDDPRKPLSNYGPDDGSSNSPKPEKSIGISSISATRTPLILERKDIIILYHRDNQLHQNAVFCLANFLEDHCNMNVYQHDSYEQDITSRGKENWALDIMDRVHWIVIVNSRGAYEQFKHINNPGPSDSHILGDMFSCGLKMLDRHTDIYGPKCISVYFPYTSENELILRFTPQGIIFKLMDKMESFFLHVHGHPKYDPRGNEEIVSEIANRHEYDQTEHGKQLKDLIKKMMIANGISPTVEADVEHQNNLDSGLESGFTDMTSLEGNFQTVFENDIDYEHNECDASSNNSKDPETWSCESIGSVARKEVEQFEEEHTAEPWMNGWNTQFIRDCNDVNVDINVDENYC